MTRSIVACTALAGAAGICLALALWAWAGAEPPGLRSQPEMPATPDGTMGPFVFETALETEQQQAQPQDRWRPWTRALGFGTLALLGATAVLTVVRRRTAAALKWHARVGWVTLGMAVAYAVVTLLRS